MLSMCAKTVREVDSFVDNFTNSTFGESETEVQPITDFSLEKVTQRSRLSSVKRSSSNSNGRPKQLRTSPSILFSGMSSLPSTGIADTPPVLSSDTGYSSPPRSLFSGGFSSDPAVPPIPAPPEVSTPSSQVDAMTVLQQMFKRQKEGFNHAVVTTVPIQLTNTETARLPEKPLEGLTSGMLTATRAFSPISTEQKIVKSPNSTSVEFNLPRSAFSPTVKIRQESPMDVRGDISGGPPPTASSPPQVTSEPEQAIEEEGTTNSAAEQPEVKGEPVAMQPPPSNDSMDRDDDFTRVPEEIPEESDKMEMMPQSPDEILNQLDSLNQTDFGAIQNFADSLSMIGTLQDNNLAGTLASSLNLSGLGAPAGSSPLVPHLGSIMGQSGKLLGRLEDNSPSMLNMVCNSSGSAAALKSLGVPSGPVAGGRRFRCPHCNKCYASYDCLSRHKRIHTGANKKTCPQCYRLFFRADHFKTHLSTCTRKNGMKKPSDFEAEEESRIIWANCMHDPDMFKVMGNRDFRTAI